MNVLALPEGYRELETVDLLKDRKAFLIVNCLSLVIALAMVLLVIFRIPFFSTKQSVLKWFVIVAGIFVYMVLHEWVHGICIQLFAHVKPTYGFSIAYAYAGTDKAWFDKKSYAVIALAPVVVWGVVLLALQAIVPVSWFWVVYCIQVLNVSGAAGDIYVAWKLSRLPSDILVQDTGVAMKFYGRN